MAKKTPKKVEKKIVGMEYPLIISGAEMHDDGKWYPPENGKCFTVLLTEAHMKTLCDKGKAASNIFKQLRAVMNEGFKKFNKGKEIPKNK